MAKACAAPEAAATPRAAAGMASGTRRAALWGALHKAKEGVLSIAADVIDTVGDTGDSDSDSAAGSDDSTGSRFLADYDDDGGGPGGGAAVDEELSPPSPATVLLASAARVSVSRRETAAPGTSEGAGCGRGSTRAVRRMKH